MTDWNDRIQTHAVNTTLAQIQEQLAAVPQQTDPSVVDTLDRISRVIHRTRSLIADADPLMVSTALLDVVQASTAPVPSRLAEFAAHGDPTHLVGASDALDGLIHNVGWQLAYAAHDPAGLREAAANYRRSVGQLIRALSEEVAELRGQIPALTEATKVRGVEIEAAAETATTTINTAVTAAQARLAALEVEIEAQKTRLATLMSDYNSQFLTGETARTAKADAGLAETIGRAETILAEQTAKHTASRTAAEEDYVNTLAALNERAEVGLTDIDVLKERAMKLVNTIGAVGFSGSYGSYAEQEKRPANIWRAVTAWSIVALIAVQLYLALAHGPASITWENLAQRALVSVPFLVLAAFAAAQSGRHRRAEQQARQRELELAAMDPYLVLLPVEDQRAIKTEAARRMFAHPPSETRDGDDRVGAPQLLHLIEEFIKRSGRG